MPFRSPSLQTSSPSSLRSAGRQPRNTTIPLFPFRLEHNLDPKLLAILIEPRPEPPFPAIDLSRLQLKPAGLIRFRRDEQVLKILVRRFIHLLFERRHEPHPRHHVRCDLVVL